MIRTSWMMVVIVALLAGGCSKTPAYLYGRDLNDLKFHAFTASVGIYPDRSVLDDPSNPFIEYPPTDDGKWVLESTAPATVAFYSWASLNAVNPYGEAQFYVGKDLTQVWRTGQVATPDDLTKAHDLAVAAYQSVLDNFPTSVSYDKTGKIPFELATPAYQAIVEDLKDHVKGGWVLLTVDGKPKAVKP